MKTTQKNIFSSLGHDWKKALKSEFNKDYMVIISQFLEEVKRSGKIFYPEEKNLFSCMKITPFTEVKL